MWRTSTSIALPMAEKRTGSRAVTVELPELVQRDLERSLAAGPCCSPAGPDQAGGTDVTEAGRSRDASVPFSPSRSSASPSLGERASRPSGRGGARRSRQGGLRYLSELPYVMVNRWGARVAPARRTPDALAGEFRGNKPLGGIRIPRGRGLLGPRERPLRLLAEAGEKPAVVCVQPGNRKCRFAGCFSRSDGTRTRATSGVTGLFYRYDDLRRLTRYRSIDAGLRAFGTDLCTIA